MVDNYWEKADLSLDNSAYWDEIAHANSNSDFDADYWQVIKPNMTRFDESGNGASYSTLDFSLWAKVGNAGGTLGDNVAGNRDSNELPVPLIVITVMLLDWQCSRREFIEHNGKILKQCLTHH